LTRPLRAAAIVLYFAVMMTLLARDYLLPAWRGDSASRVSTSLLADQFIDKDEWMRLRLNNLPIGGMRSATFRTADGFGTTAQVFLNSRFAQGRVTTAASLNERMELRQVRALVEMGNETLELAGMVQGTELLLRLSGSGGVKYHTIAIKDPITMTSAADPLLSGEEMAAGEDYAVDIYDPLWGMEAGRLRLRLTGLVPYEDGGRIVQARLAEGILGNIQTKFWIGPDGRHLRREIRFRAETGAGDGEGGESLLSNLALVMESLDKKVGEEEFPDLQVQPALPELEAASMRGQDTGEPLRSLGLLNLLIRGRSGALESLNDAQSNPGKP